MMDEFISRQALKDLGSECIAKRDENGNLMPLGSIDSLPSVNPQASKEDIHREREQAYMKGYEDASKRYRAEPCDDAISRTDAISVASGYCHWSNIPDELEKLPSVCTEKTGRWKEVQFRTIPYNRISKAKKCSVCGKRKDKYVTWNYCPNCGAKMEVEE